MTVTLTASYRDILDVVTVGKIDELIEENYELSDMLEFIDIYNENDFVAYYEEYVRVGEIIGYDAVDALIGEMGSVCDIQDCEDRYRGEYRSEADFAEEYYSELYDVPCALVVDWEATWDTSLRYDFTFCDGHIFSDY